MGGGADGHRLAGSDLTGDHAQPAGVDEVAQPGDGFLVGGGAEQVVGGQVPAEGHLREAPMRLQTRNHDLPSVGQGQG